MPDDKKQPALKEEEIVRSLVPDPAQPPDVRVLVGFLGKSAQERSWRLYVTPNFSEYVEFAEADVVHSRTLQTGPSTPLGGTVVWLKRGANVMRVRTTSREAQADFLQGSIARRIACPPGGRSFTPAHRHLATPFQTVHVSCVADFCDFVALSFLGGGDVFCGGGGTWDCTWTAECQ
jgi:hypothetical protein